MFEQQGAETTQADDSTQPPAGTSSSAPAAGAQTGQAPSATEESGTGSEPMTTETARLIRKENNSLRQRIAAAEKLIREREEAGLSELDKTSRRVKELEAELERERTMRREDLLTTAVQTHATKLGFIDPEDPLRL